MGPPRVIDLTNHHTMSGHYTTELHLTSACYLDFLLVTVGVSGVTPSIVALHRIHWVIKTEWELMPTHQLPTLGLMVNQ